MNYVCCCTSCLSINFPSSFLLASKLSLEKRTVQHFKNKRMGVCPKCTEYNRSLISISNKMVDYWSKDYLGDLEEMFFLLEQIELCFLMLANAQLIFWPIPAESSKTWAMGSKSSWMWLTTTKYTMTMVNENLQSDNRAVPQLSDLPSCSWRIII